MIKPFCVTKRWCLILGCLRWNTGRWSPMTDSLFRTFTWVKLRNLPIIKSGRSEASLSLTTAPIRRPPYSIGKGRKKRKVSHSAKQLSMSLVSRSATASKSRSFEKMAMWPLIWPAKIIFWLKRGFESISKQIMRNLWQTCKIWSKWCHSDPLGRRLLGCRHRWPPWKGERSHLHQLWHLIRCCCPTWQRTARWPWSTWRNPQSQYLFQQSPASPTTHIKLTS